jgi:starch-binding outer membrane protein, SusD/RagB family
MKKNFIRILAISALVSAGGCTKLEEKLNGSIPEQNSGSANVASLLQASYDNLRSPFQDQARLWAAQEHTSDEAAGPTRGGDWDDNGIWRVLHRHTWDADHAFLRDTYSDLGKVIFGTTDLLRFSPTASQAAQARFLRVEVRWNCLKLEKG